MAIFSKGENDMKKRQSIYVFIICTCLLGLFLVTAFAYKNISIYKMIGEYFKQANENEEKSFISVTSSTLVPLADYHGQVVYQADVNYYKKINVFFSSDATKTLPTEEETLNKILENIILYEEAERLGFTATQSEIDEMVNNAKLAYTLPEGKEILDQYCEGAQMTVNEYFEFLEKQAPRSIARQKLIDSVGQKFCEENGLTFTKVNPPKELVEAREAYISDLFIQAKKDVKYYSD